MLIAIGEVRTQKVFYKGEFHNRSAFGLQIENNGMSTGTIDIYSTDELVDTVFVQLELNKDNYQLGQLLGLLGKPNNIFISAQTSSPVAELASTILILDYRERGILIWYEYPTIRIGENLQFCFNSKRTSLELWNPSLDVDRTPIDEYLTIITGSIPKHLVEATAFSLGSFYETFVNSSSDECIETPANLWP